MYDTQAAIMKDWLVNTQDPACIIFLVEQSDMPNKTGISGYSLSFEMKRIVDLAIDKLVKSNSKGDEVLPRVKIGVFGYSDTHFSWRLNLNRDECGLKMLSNEFHMVKEEYVDDKLELFIPSYFLEKNHGKEDMASGISNLIEIVEEFVVKHPESVPPIVYHLTQGNIQHSQKKNVLAAMEELKSIATSTGNTMLFNIRINSDLEEPLIFPHRFSDLNDLSDVTLMEGSSCLSLDFQKMYSHHSFGYGKFFAYNPERKCLFLLTGATEISEILIRPFFPLSSRLMSQSEFQISQKGFMFHLDIA
jgi:hypothetical protein